MARYAAWLACVEGSLCVVQELVDLSRLVQVFRAPLRVGRQVRAAAYELHACARLVDVVRTLDLHVRTRGRRHADAQATFLSQSFHVEVKAHEDLQGGGRRGGVRAAQTLWQAAREQSSPSTPNLLVLGHVEARALRRVAQTAAPDARFGALVGLDLQPRRQRWRGVFLPVPGAQSPFTPALLEVLRGRFEHA